MSVVSVEQLGDAVKGILDEYNAEVIKGTKDAAKEAMDQLVSDTKATAPRRRPKYYKMITSKKEWETNLGVQYLWYVKGNEYRLSHLLEYGHANRDGGRTAGTHFIEHASDSIIKDYISRVEEVVKRG